MEPVATVETLQPTEPQAKPAVPRKLRLWFPIVMLVPFWAYILGNEWIDMPMFTRFISRMGCYAALLIFFTGWWLAQRGLRFRDRLLAFLLLVGGTALVSQVTDPTINAFIIVMIGYPIVFTVWTAWLALTRRSSPALQRLGVYAGVVCTLGFYTLLRCDGLDGAQRAELSWRWTPTAEQRFLASHAKEAAAKDEVLADAKPWKLQPGDWPEFRGPRRDGVATGVQIPTDWTKTPPRELWRKPVGPGWSSVIVVDDHLVTQEQRGEAEAVVCYEAATGREVWSHEDAGRFYEGLAGAGPRATPTYHDGRIYTLGAKALLNCLEAATGKQIWSHDLVAEVGAEIPQWGVSSSPLVVDDLVIVYAGGTEGRTLLAYDAKSGDLRWSSAGGKMSYSSPELDEIAGQRQIVMHDNKSVAGFDIADGKRLWERAGLSEVAMPMLQPHFLDGGILLLSTDPNLTRFDIAADGGKCALAEGWNSNRLKAGFNDFVVYEGNIYGLDDGIGCCLDLETGNRRWKKGRYGHGEVLLIPDSGVLLVLSETGELILMRATPENPEELGRLQALNGKTWNHPVIAHGRLFVRNGEEMACYDVKGP
jgi:outer membrane protein assembly factor BamB